jgi:hypothetical protein
MSPGYSWTSTIHCALIWNLAAKQCATITNQDKDPLEQSVSVARRSMPVGDSVSGYPSRAMSVQNRHRPKSWKGGANLVAMEPQKRSGTLCYPLSFLRRSVHHFFFIAAAMRAIQHFPLAMIVLLGVSAPVKAAAACPWSDGRKNYKLVKFGET